MRWWRPVEGEAELWAWWAPLLAVARRARADRVPWPILADEFDLLGRIDRPPRPSVWVYRHRLGGGLIRTDDRGHTYVLRPSGSAAWGAQHVEVDVRRAVWAADLPSVVTPVWFEPPPSRRWEEDDDDLDGWSPPPPPPRHRPHPHLQLVGGPPAG